MPEYDIFVSYAHVDDEPPTETGVDKGWVATLIEGLERGLARLLKEAGFSLWIDRELSPHEPVSRQIRECCAESAVLVVMLSKAYLESEWCRKERQYFLDITKNRYRSYCRVFIVELDEIKMDQRPDELKDMTGYRFWRKEGGTPRRLGDPVPDPLDSKDKEYYTTLNKLFYDLAAELDRLRNPEPESHPGPDKEPDPTPDHDSPHQPGNEGEPERFQTQDSTPNSENDEDMERFENREPSPEPETIEEPAVFVYLAETTDDLYNERENLKKHLKQARIRVLPAKTHSYNNLDAFKTNVKEDLKKCKVFIQLLSQHSGRKDPNIPSYILVQYELAAELGNPILQWRGDNVVLDEVCDKEHLKLLTGDGVFVGQMPLFKQEIIKKAFTDPVDQEFPGSPVVLVSANDVDKNEAEKISDVMHEHGMDLILHSWGTQLENFLDELENLAKVIQIIDGILVVYGAVDAARTIKWLRHCQKLRHRSEKSPRPMAIYDGPPYKKLNLSIRFKGVHVIPCRNGVQGEKCDFKPFVEALRGGGPI